MEYNEVVIILDGMFSVKEKKMHFWIGVENFAKIESAKICVDNYTVLVGQNNSGKTYLMQLVQGMGKKVVNLMDGLDIREFLVERTDSYKKYELNKENLSTIVSYVNEKLSVEKENIVKEIFGREISIERLYIDISIDEKTIYNLAVFTPKKQELKEQIVDVSGIEIDTIYTQMIDNWSWMLRPDMAVCIVNKKNIETKENEIISMQLSVLDEEVFIFKTGIRNIMEKESLFLPASRTGLMLLYREFFANKADNERSFIVKGNQIVENKDNYGNLTQPVYEFLRFLQTYSEDEEIKKGYHKELKFFEEHLIEGHISMNKHGAFDYSSASGNEKVPMHLASSMINEVAPLALAITAKEPFSRLIVDEAEASLHPQKQLELVRFLNRLNNQGISLIISTHSDTFVSKLNNLHVLSEAVEEKGEDILSQFNLEKEDLIAPEKLFVYEFVNQPNGKSIVKEIKGNHKTGYQFDLFTDSAIHLYEEATKLGELNDKY